MSPGDESQAPPGLQASIDALARGECTEEEFLSDALAPHESEPAWAWTVLSHIDQRYRRGQLSEQVFLSMKSRISQRAIYERRELVTVELTPSPSQSVGLGPAMMGMTVELTPPDAAPLRAVPPGPMPPTPLPSPSATADRPRAEPPTIQAGRILRNRYVIHSLLDRGGMGDIFKASDGLGVLRSGACSSVAVKVLRQSTHECPEHVLRLQREFDSTRRLSHPNIVKVFDFDRDGDIAFYTMELLDGEHVAQRLQRAGGTALPSSYAWAIIRAVGAALVHAHARQVIHGDLSPKNVMITRAGEVRVLDFGAGGGAVAATPAYASCQLLEGWTPDPADDLYSLACLAYELLAGEHPFEGRRATEARDLGLQARRPPGLAKRHWVTLQRGLGWTRSERSIPIRGWLRNLGLEPEPERLPELNTPQIPKAALSGLPRLAVPTWVRLPAWPRLPKLPVLARWPALPTRVKVTLAKWTLAKWTLAKVTLAKVTVSKATLTLWPRLPRLPQLPGLSPASSMAVAAATLACCAIAWHGRLRSVAASATPAAEAAVPPLAAASGPAGVPPRDPLPDAAPLAVAAIDPRPVPLPTDIQPTPVGVPSDASQAPASGQPMSPRARARARAAARRAAAAERRLAGVKPGGAKAPGLQFSANRYAIPANAHFVEARVWRSRMAGDTKAFVWWTEASSAKAGQDFLAQGRTPYIFSQGRQTASLFIRLIPNAERTRSANFRVCVGRPGAGSSVSDVFCSAILLTPNPDRPS